MTTAPPRCAAPHEAAATLGRPDSPTIWAPCVLASHSAVAPGSTSFIVNTLLPRAPGRSSTPRSSSSRRRGPTGCRCAGWPSVWHPRPLDLQAPAGQAGARGGDHLRRFERQAEAFEAALAAATTRSARSHGRIAASPGPPASLPADDRAGARARPARTRRRGAGRAADLRGGRPRPRPRPRRLGVRARHDDPRARSPLSAGRRSRRGLGPGLEAFRPGAG